MACKTCTRECKSDNFVFPPVSKTFGQTLSQLNSITRKFTKITKITKITCPTMFSDRWDVLVCEWRHSFFSRSQIKGLTYKSTWTITPTDIEEIYLICRTDLIIDRWLRQRITRVAVTQTSTSSSVFILLWFLQLSHDGCYSAFWRE